MRNVIYKALCVLFVCFRIAHAHENGPCDSCEKLYLQPDQIAINEEGIFIQLGGEWMITNAIHRDGTGLYVSTAHDEGTFSWECRVCHRKNGPLDSKCPGCGTPPWPRARS